MSEILIVAAMPEELDVIRKRSPSAADRLRRRRRGEREPLVTAEVIGETPTRAAPALQRLLTSAERPYEAVLLVGVAGGLTADLSAADVIVPVRVGTSAVDAPAPDAAWLAGLPSDLGRRGRLVSIERVAASAEAKRRLAAELDGALAVDLETAAVAEVAARQAIPLLVLRAISDRLDETMPQFLQECFNEDGSMNRLKVVLSANLRPSRWKILMGLRRRMMRCATALADAAEVAIGFAPKRR